MTWNTLNAAAGGSIGDLSVTGSSSRIRTGSDFESPLGGFGLLSTGLLSPLDAVNQTPATMISACAISSQLLAFSSAPGSMPSATSRAGAPFCTHSGKTHQNALEAVSRRVTASATPSMTAIACATGGRWSCAMRSNIADLRKRPPPHRLQAWDQGRVVGRGGGSYLCAIAWTREK